MPKNRKRVKMLLTVSVPAGTTAARTRLEVRSLIDDLCSYFLYPGDVKVRSIKPQRRK